jgi:hypothetical protein
MEKEDDERPFSELSRAERRAKARKLLFGTQKDEYLGNIWGWRFSAFSFIGLILVGLVALYGVYTGRIDPQKMKEDSGTSVFVSPKIERPNQAVKDSLK